MSSNATTSVTSPVPGGPRGRTYLNAVLTVNAVLLGVLALNSAGGGVRTAVAQPPTGQYAGVPGSDLGDDPSGRVSAAEQRKQMISELRGLSQRVEKMDALLARGISVKVTSMPPIPGLEKANDRNEVKPEMRIETKQGK